MRYLQAHELYQIDRIIIKLRLEFNSNCDQSLWVSLMSRIYEHTWDKRGPCDAAWGIRVSSEIRHTPESVRELTLPLITMWCPMWIHFICSLQNGYLSRAYITVLIYIFFQETISSQPPHPPYFSPWFKYSLEEIYCFAKTQNENKKK